MRVAIALTLVALFVALVAGTRPMSVALGAPGDAACLVSQSPYPTVNDGEHVIMNWTYKNCGTTAWSYEQGFRFTIQDEWPSNIAPGNLWCCGNPLLPGQSGSISLGLSVFGAGVHRFGFTITHNGQSIGPHFFIEVTVRPRPGPCDSANFLGQSDYPTVEAGRPFQIYFEVRNTGSCTWRQSDNYRLENTNGVSLGALPRQELGSDVPPGASKRWTINMAAPGTAGNYRTQWMLRHGDSTFGPNMFIDVTVREAPTTAYPCKSTENGLDVCGLRKGDIIFLHFDDSPLFFGQAVAFGGYWTHVGIYNGDGTVTEANGTFGLGFPPCRPNPGVRRHRWDMDLDDPQNQQSAYWRADDWSVKRVRNSSAVDGAVSYANSKADAHTPYNCTFTNETSETAFYCSQLVWRAFLNQGIDLDSNKALRLPIAVPPDDLYLDDDLLIVTEKDVSFIRIILRLLSPADLWLTDSLNRSVGHDPTTGMTSNQVPGAIYTGPASEPEAIALVSQNGSLNVKVIGTGGPGYGFVVEILSPSYRRSETFRSTYAGKVDEFILNPTNVDLLESHVVSPTAALPKPLAPQVFQNPLAQAFVIARSRQQTNSTHSPGVTNILAAVPVFRPPATGDGGILEPSQISIGPPKTRITANERAKNSAAYRHANFRRVRKEVSPGSSLRHRRVVSIQDPVHGMAISNS